MYPMSDVLGSSYLTGTLNEDVVHLAPGSGYFEPTTQWHHERAWARLSSSRHPGLFPE